MLVLSHSVRILPLYFVHLRTFDTYRGLDPDPQGSALFLEAESESAFECKAIRIRIKVKNS